MINIVFIFSLFDTAALLIILLIIKLFRMGQYFLWESQ